MASKSKQKTGRDRAPRQARDHVIVEDDVIVEEVLMEEEEYSQMNFLSGREEVSSAKLQEIYDRWEGEKKIRRKRKRRTRRKKK